MKITSRIIMFLTAIGVIVVPFVIWGINQNKPDVRFTLSDPIQLGQVDGGKIWQQIEVRNNGNIEAKDIQIKVNAQISSHEISKNSEADKPEIFPSADIFELRYPILPPGGVFTLTLGATKSKVELANISVLHNKGRGVEAFSRKSFFAEFIAWAVVILLGLFYLIAGGRSVLVDELESDSKCRSESLLMKQKPFYIGDQRWSRLRNTAIENVLSYSDKYKDDTSATKVYRILCDEKPSYLSDDEWNKRRKAAEAEVEENLLRRIRSAYESDKLLLAVQLKRPNNMSEITWLNLQKEANERFLELMQRKFEWASLDKLSTFLKEEIPEGIEQNTWKKYVESLEKKYVDEIERGLYFSDKPYEFLEQQNLSRLSETDTSRLKDKAYRLAIKQFPDLHKLKEAENFLKETKPKWMTGEDYEKYTQIAQKTVDLESLMKEYNEKAALLEKEKAELSKNIETVTSQLEIINQVLRDPTVLERIEEYNNPFAPGNFVNLKKIVEFIKEVEETSQK